MYTAASSFEGSGQSLYKDCEIAMGAHLSLWFIDVSEESIRSRDTKTKICLSHKNWNKKEFLITISLR